MYKKKSNKQLLNILFNHNYFYPTAININYTWSFGSLTGLFFALQIITGIFLAMHYVPNEFLAFKSIEHILRDVNYGFILKNLHSNGASFVFLFLYLHIARGILIRSYTSKRILLWKTGIILFLLMILTAFIGYVLPWGQMSYWGATVITNLITAIPYIGQTLAIWIWGDFTVSNATLNRFFSLHFLLPFIILGLIFYHLMILHEIGSSTPLSSTSSRDKLTFFTYFGIKDLASFISILIAFNIFVFFYPNALGHSDNFIKANALVTPTHIVPEWYFLPFYAILRSIPDKLYGVIAMVGAILGLSFISIATFFNNFFVKTSRCAISRKWIIYGLFVNFLLLGFIGGQPANSPYTNIGKYSTLLYFSGIIYLEIGNKKINT